MEIEVYEINAFSAKNFSGNPAAVCPLKEFLPAGEMQSIAAQNNLPETAFIVQKSGNEYDIRWFAPESEVDLCGHATLAAAHALFQHINPELQTVTFNSASGKLNVRKNDGLIELDFPARFPEKQESILPIFHESSNSTPLEVLASDDYIIVLENEKEIQDLIVDMDKLASLDRRGVIFTAKGTTADFVSRVFHPKLGIGEDPVCGSAHCQLTPYWSHKLQKRELKAKQLSPRGGEILCSIKEQRVLLSGEAKTYLKGTLFI